MDQIEVGHKSDDGVYRDFCDGSAVKTNPTLRQSNSIQLAFYFDELEVSNPLGSKKGKHKLGMVCMCQKNIIFRVTHSRCFLLDNIEHTSCLSLVSSFNSTFGSSEVSFYKEIWDRHHFGSCSW